MYHESDAHPLCCHALNHSFAKKGDACPAVFLEGPPEPLFPFWLARKLLGGLARRGGNRFFPASTFFLRTPRGSRNSDHGSRPAKFFGIRTYRIRVANSFEIRTYEKMGWGGGCRLSAISLSANRKARSGRECRALPSEDAGEPAEGAGKPGATFHPPRLQYFDLQLSAVGCQL